MAYSPIASAISAGGANGSTTGAIDTTGADFIALVVTSYVASGAATVSDSKGNTWSARTYYTGSVVAAQIFYCQAPTVGSGHTFTCSGTSTFSTIAVEAFSGSTASPYDTESGAGNASSASTIQPGSITPSENNCLIISGTGWNSSGSTTVDGGFSETGELSPGGGNNFGTVMSYLIQTSAAAANPTVTFSPAYDYAATAIASFKAAAGGGGGGGKPHHYYAQMRQQAAR